MRLFILVLALCGAGCSRPEAPGALRDLTLAPTPVGAERLELIPYSFLGLSEGDAPSLGPSAFSVSEADLGLSLRWAPADAADTASLTLSLPDGRSATIRATATGPVALPDPLAVSQGLEALGSAPGSGLGSAVFDGEGPVPFAADPLTGNAWFGEASSGKAWRLDPFYRHPIWGLWVAEDRRGLDLWEQAPDCFLTVDGLFQSGDCDGSERDLDGEIPRGWQYFHGGFAGDGEELAGLSALAADPARGRVWALASGVLRGIDTDLRTTPDEPEGAYSFSQVVDGLRLPLGPFWRQSWAGVADDQLWLVDRGSGRVASLDLPPSEGALTVRFPGLPDGEVSGATGALGASLLFVGADRWVGALDRASGQVAWGVSLPAGLLRGEPVASAARGDRAWFAWPEGILTVEAGEAHLILPPEGAQIAGIAADLVEGGDAAPMALLYVVGQRDGEGWLWAASWDGAWLGEGLALPAAPRALGYGAEAHDLYVLYAAGTGGCDGALAETCAEGSHPAVVQPLYNPYGLVPPASRGQPLNLFLSPLIETPLDTEIDEDFSQGHCPDAAEGLATTCCALRWVVDERLAPNLAYFQDRVGRLGADTEGEDDDPTLVYGLNPSVLRTARLCLASDDPVDVEAGVALYRVLAGVGGPRVALSTLTHTGLSMPDEHLDYYLQLLYDSPDDYALPIDSQSEYLALHAGLSAALRTDDLGLSDLAALDLQSTLGAGNGFDAEELLGPDGWADGSWVEAIRDGPLALGLPPRRGFYFLSAGADPEIGTVSSRKKELWPLDIRERMKVTGLPLDPADIVSPDPDSDLALLPGMSWEIGTLDELSRGGAFRETLKYGDSVDAPTWDLVFRNLRRLAATGDADSVKCWYQHFFDLNHPAGLYAENSGVNADQDVNLDGLRRIQTELIDPGYARWALPSEILDDWEAARAR